MAVDMFLKIDTVDGESSDAKHKGEIEILSYSFGASNAGSFSSGGGGGTGKVSFQDLHFTCSVSKASPKLFLACATGEHFKKATLTCRKSGGTQNEFLYIKLEDCLVSSVQQGSNPLDTGFSNLPSTSFPTEMISLNFTKIEFDYFSRDGSPPTTATWDIKNNVGG